MFPKNRLKGGRGNLYRALGNFQFLLNVVHLRECHSTPHLDKENAKSNRSSAPQHRHSRRKWELDRRVRREQQRVVCSSVPLGKPSRHKANHNSAKAAVRSASCTNVVAKTMHIKNSGFRTISGKYMEGSSKEGQQPYFPIEMRNKGDMEDTG